MCGLKCVEKKGEWCGLEVVGVLAAGPDLNHVKIQNLTAREISGN